MNNPSSRALFCGSLLFLMSAISLEAQRSPEISAAVGALQFDGSGTDIAPMIALRAAVPLVSSWLLGEASFSFASPTEQFSNLSSRIGVAEAQVQLQLPLARVRPYLGAGAGWLHLFNNAAGRETTPSTFSAAAGFRLGLSRHFGARAELRLRGWQGQREPTGKFAGGAAEWTGGLAYTF